MDFGFSKIGWIWIFDKFYLGFWILKKISLDLGFLNENSLDFGFCKIRGIFIGFGFFKKLFLDPGFWSKKVWILGFKDPPQPPPLKILRYTINYQKNIIGSWIFARKFVGFWIL